MKIFFYSVSYFPIMFILLTDKIINIWCVSTQPFFLCIFIQFDFFLCEQKEMHSILWFIYRNQSGSFIALFPFFPVLKSRLPWVSLNSLLLCAYVHFYRIDTYKWNLWFKKFKSFDKYYKMYSKSFTILTLHPPCMRGSRPLKFSIMNNKHL